MRVSIILLLSIGFFHCKSNLDEPARVETKEVNTYFSEGNKIAADFMDSLKSEQIELVSALTGSSKVSKDIFLSRRWSSEEKVLVRKYLTKFLEEFNLKLLEQKYVVNLPYHNDMSKLNPYRGVNVYGILSATKPTNEYIIIGAHYDSVKESPGASDNATGCALVYGVSRLLSKLETRKKNVMYVFFDQEETGHAGSYAFVKFTKDNRFTIHSVHTADQVGWDKDGDRNIELELPNDNMLSLYRRHAEPYGIKIYTTEVTSSDHKEWREAGYNAVGITEEYKNGDTSPYHHDPEDTCDTVNFDYLAFVTYLVFTVIQELLIT